MGKPILVASLASAGALYASYNAAKAFVPALGNTQGNIQEKTNASLRGVRSNDDLGHTASSSGLSSVAGVTGALALVSLGSSRHLRVQRHATATSEATKVDNGVESPPPPPPFDPAKQLGATAPLGFFDPLGFAKVGDEPGFRNLRIAELKHGRVAMMAAVGAVFQHVAQFPGFEKIPKGIGAVLSSPGTEGFAALFLLSGALELLVWKEDPSKPVDSIGDYGNPLQLGVGEPLGESEDMKNRELNNGRAAMFAIAGIVAAELATGKDALQQFGFS